MNSKKAKANGKIRREGAREKALQREEINIQIH